MATDSYIGCNVTIAQVNCTLETCCLAQSHFLYRPTYGGNLFFAIYFGFFLLVQIGLGIRYRTWGFMTGMIFGLTLEFIGYVERVQIHSNPFGNNPFLIYLIFLTIGPVFISASIYLCLNRMIMLYGEHLSQLKPRTIALTFMTSDFLSLVLQAAGGAIVDTTNSHNTYQDGEHIAVAGLILQAVSLATFLALMAYFAWCCRKGVLDMNPDKQRVRRSALFVVFLVSLVIATICILIRSIFRSAELWEGFSGSLWNNETDFMVLDGAMVALATLLLTAFHPGVMFRGQWQASNWRFRTSKSEHESQEKLSEEHMKGASDQEIAA